MKDLHFKCTGCGRCCQDLKLPLTVQEAGDWLALGHAVQVICDALPWPGEPGVTDLQAVHRARRSFRATSGSMPASVVVILAANLAGRCPNLTADWRCGIYAHRPLVCRIYPAEINPFIALDPARKACPPEAWTAGHPLLSIRGRLSDSDALADIERSRDTDRRDVSIKRSLCSLLHIRTVALAGEGFVVHSPEPAVLLAALRQAAGEPQLGTPDGPWQFVSDQAESVTSLRSGGALAIHPGSDAAPAYEYLGFH